MVLMMLPDFLARQLTIHAISLRCSPTVTRYESSVPPSTVLHNDAASARGLTASALPRSLPISTTACLSREEVLGRRILASGRAPLQDGAAVHPSRLNMATNMVGVVCLIRAAVSRPLVVSSQRKQWQCVLTGRSGYEQRSV